MWCVWERVFSGVALAFAGNNVGCAWGWDLQEIYPNTSHLDLVKMKMRETMKLMEEGIVISLEDLCLNGPRIGEKCYYFWVALFVVKNIYSTRGRPIYNKKEARQDYVKVNVQTSTSTIMPFLGMDPYLTSLSHTRIHFNLDSVIYIRFMTISISFISLILICVVMYTN